MTRPTDGQSTVLALNTGSSSLKFAVYELGPRSERRVAHGAVENIGGGDGSTWVEQEGQRTEQKSGCSEQAAALDSAFILLAQQRLAGVDMVGHRVVHGGPHHVRPERVDAALMESLHRLIPLAPLHLPACLAAMQAVSARFPSLPQVACFDTAFHATLPRHTRTLPLPARFEEVRRYGFHGLSYEYVMSTLGADAPSRIVIAHLGNGASLVAVKDGSSVDTTMSLTPAGGILMGTRSGDIDPGVLVYLAREYGMDARALERCFDQECGLLAVGGTSDMKALIERSATDPSAALAVEMFGYAVRKQIAGFAGALGGLDLLVFTGGIGERAGSVRMEACRGLQDFGITLDAAANASGASIISASSSRVVVKVVKADEDIVIARHTRQLVESAKKENHAR